MLGWGNASRGAFVYLLVFFSCLALADKPAPAANNSGAVAGPNSFGAGRQPAQLTYDPQTEQQDCSDYDLRPEIGARGLPAERHQGQSGWCYAYVAADLVSYELRANVSPADIAINYINRNSETLLNANSPLALNFPLGGGFTHLAVQALHERGVCRNEDFPIDLSRPEPVAPLIYDNQGRIAGKGSTAHDPLNHQGLLTFFTDARIEQRLTLIRQISFIEALNQLAQVPACQPQFSDFRVPANVDHWTRLKDRPAFNQRLNALLDQQRLVAISYDQAILDNGAAQYMAQQPSAQHISSIVGRRYNSEKTRCEYLIRNSQGSCAEVSEDFSCADNHVWVPRQVVQYGTAYTTYLGEER